MRLLIPLVVVVVFFLIAMFGTGGGGDVVFGVVIPYLALAVFAIGFVYRINSWARAPVPFRIPTTSGQEKSLPWIKNAPLDNPHSTIGVIGRMLLEVLFFRSLLKNTKTDLSSDKHLTYASSPFLWIGSMAFHWSMLVILVRHLRFFTEPVPSLVTSLQQIDGFLQIGAPVFYITSFIFPAGLLYLLGRRLFDPRLRYISLANDYFPLFLLLGIGGTGFWLRYLDKTDIVGAKELVIGLVSFRPVVPEGIAPLFYAHLFLVSILMIYFPFSKLMHAGGVFLSPTRNQANNNRMKRHVNPWDYPVKVHTYEEYEDEFREKMKGAGVPVEKD